MRLAAAPVEATVGPARGWNALPGVIRDLVYTGSDTQYVVELGPAGVVMVRVPSDMPPEGRPQAGPGERVRVGWEVGSTAVQIPVTAWFRGDSPRSARNQR